MSSYDPQCGNTTLPGYKQLSPTNTFFLLFPFRQVFGGALPTSLKSLPQLNTFSNCTKYPTDLYNLAYAGSTLVDINNYLNTVIYEYLRYWNSSTLSIILNTYLTTLTFPTNLSTLTQADIKRINTSVQARRAFSSLIWAFNVTLSSCFSSIGTGNNITYFPIQSSRSVCVATIIRYLTTTITNANQRLTIPNARIPFPSEFLNYYISLVYDTLNNATLTPTTSPAYPFRLPIYQVFFPFTSCRRTRNPLFSTCGSTLLTNTSDSSLQANVPLHDAIFGSPGNIADIVRNWTASPPTNATLLTFFNILKIYTTDCPKANITQRIPCLLASHFRYFFSPIMNAIVGFSLNPIQQLNSTLIAPAMIKSCNDGQKNLDAINRGQLFSLIGYGFTYAAIVLLYALVLHPKYIGNFLCLSIPFLFCLIGGSLVLTALLGIYKAPIFKSVGGPCIPNKPCLNTSSSAIYALLHSIFLLLSSLVLFVLMITSLFCSKKIDSKDEPSMKTETKYKDSELPV